MKRRERGIVTSNKMDKTIVVEVERLVRHPRYERHIRRRTVLKAHDAHDEAQPGDWVELEETRPLSKTKSWRLVRILRRALRGEAVLPLEAALPPETGRADGPGARTPGA